METQIQTIQEYSDELESVSIVIPALNESRNIKRLIAFFDKLKETSLLSIELIFDISGSTDNSSEVLKNILEYRNDIKFLDRDIKDGLYTSLAHLLVDAHSDVIVRMDADVSISQDSFYKLLLPFSSENVGLTAPRIVSKIVKENLVSKMHQLEYRIHHLVCLLRPKTTNVQLIRNIGISLPKRIGVEDIEIQNQIESKGYKVKYVPEAIAEILPPLHFKDYIRQRVRNIIIQRAHKKLNGVLSSTQDPRIVAKQTLLGIRNKKLPFFLTFVFFAVELLCHGISLASSLNERYTDYFSWDPVNGTKDFQKIM